jgi:hypothetical protein
LLNLRVGLFVWVAKRIAETANHARCPLAALPLITNDYWMGTAQY